MSRASSSFKPAIDNNSAKATPSSSSESKQDCQENKKDDEKKKKEEDQKEEKRKIEEEDERKRQEDEKKKKEEKERDGDKTKEENIAGRKSEQDVFSESLPASKNSKTNIRAKKAPSANESDNQPAASNTAATNADSSTQQRARSTAKSSRMVGSRSFGDNSMAARDKEAVSPQSNSLRGSGGRKLMTLQERKCDAKHCNTLPCIRPFLFFFFFFFFQCTCSPLCCSLRILTISSLRRRETIRAVSSDDEISGVYMRRGEMTLAPPSSFQLQSQHSAPTAVAESVLTRPKGRRKVCTVHVDMDVLMCVYGV